MNTDLIFLEVSKILKDTFGDPDMIVLRTTNAAEVEKWDSMTNLFLIDSLENKFEIKFSLDEILNAKNVGDLCNVIAETKRVL
jgi:acyl carrier protein